VAGSPCATWEESVPRPSGRPRDLRQRHMGCSSIRPPFDMGEKVLIRFQIPGEITWVAGVGQVTWRNADAQESKQVELGISVQLVEAPKEYLETIGKRLA
jgi:hypothetical protein